LPSIEDPAYSSSAICSYPPRSLIGRALSLRIPHVKSPLTARFFIRIVRVMTIWIRPFDSPRRVHLTPHFVDISNHLHTPASIDRVVANFLRARSHPGGISAHPAPAAVDAFLCSTSRGRPAQERPPPCPTGNQWAAPNRSLTGRTRSNNPRTRSKTIVFLSQKVELAAKTAELAANRPQPAAERYGVKSGPIKT
jgi:hypothetical protein